MIPISGMLETAAALYSGCHLWHKVQPRLGKKKRERKKRKCSKVSGREIWIRIPGLLNAASVISNRLPNFSVFAHYLENGDWFFLRLLLNAEG